MECEGAAARLPAGAPGWAAAAAEWKGWEAEAVAEWKGWEAEVVEWKGWGVEVEEWRPCTGWVGGSDAERGRAGAEGRKLGGPECSTASVLSFGSPESSAARAPSRPCLSPSDPPCLSAVCFLRPVNGESQMVNPTSGSWNMYPESFFCAGGPAGAGGGSFRRGRPSGRGGCSGLDTTVSFARSSATTPASSRRFWMPSSNSLSSGPGSVSYTSPSSSSSSSSENTMGRSLSLALSSSLKIFSGRRPGWRVAIGTPGGRQGRDLASICLLLLRSSSESLSLPQIPGSINSGDLGAGSARSPCSDRFANVRGAEEAKCSVM
mmetsp:Transcript_20102/g.46952  ORF Transcript_20102/g.46952 Transcript_20102/m.46952 type:complete len:320 (+) Transcript_20102:403-1362(+)